MYNLLLKEWIISKTTIAINMTLLLVTSLVTSDGQVPIYLPIIFGCVFIFGNSFQEYKNNSEVLVNSLPVSRPQIVASKYLASLLFGAVVTSFAAVLNMLLPVFAVYEMLHIVLSISLIGLFAAVYFPLYYLLGPRFIQYGFLALMLLCITVLPMVVNLGVKNGFWGLAAVFEQVSPALLSLAFLGVATVLLLVSWVISVRLYLRKEF
ncbi:ABC-2 transporter permease [Brevibacillus humidisoli]|uniref:ABC-2 transporter permease n=1 Tax=Brevibacillus humidisoli TaxID=2895522 RepID=UPI001E397FCA|nr:ABC-2 transporter permease [Brevibacillus humidisoli]UFJ41534.1 ABC-2 transporter permease [Brevibacillus humidisoli]